MPLEYNSATPLYLSDRTAHPITQVGAMLDQLDHTGKRIVIFVHGRGEEPRKSLVGKHGRGKAVHKIELGYDVRVLMFNWDSDFNGINFLDRDVPLRNAETAAADLGRMIAAINLHYAEHPERRRPALLVHSMGSIVVKNAIDGQNWPVATNVFSNVVFSEPDADDIGHAAWLERLALKENTFVTFNADDHVLRRSNDRRPHGAHALGLGTNEPLAPHARYVDLTNMGPLNDEDDDHEVFGKGRYEWPGKRLSVFCGCADRRAGHSGASYKRREHREK